jgi:DMSO/TMAO reductase YedYZ molybdopterin-dependent catalytic subunit
VRGTATEVLFEGADRGAEPGVAREIPYQMSIPVSKAFHPETLLATEMNGAPLSPSHGFPVRALVPGWYGMASVKWLTRIAFLDHPFDGYFRTRAYVYIPEGTKSDQPRVPVGAVRVKSLVTWPSEGAVISTGAHRIRGVAFSGEAPILRVDVSTEPASGGGEVWKPARLRAPASRHSWTHFETIIDLPHPGFYVIRARATDENGTTQPVHAEWNFRGVGNNSIHCVPVEVREGGPPDSP